MPAQMTISCSPDGYNAFNKAGLAVGNVSAWDGWNDGPNSAGKYGYAGVRANANIRYAFVYRFDTPSWGGTMTKINFSFSAEEELGNARSVRLSLTATDPTTSTSLYTGQTLPQDAGRVATTVLSVEANFDGTKTWEVTGSLTKNKTYYLVVSPNTSSGSNYITIPDDSFTATITYEADASAVSANDGYIGSAIAISMTNDGLTKTLSYSFGSASGSIGSTSGASYSWTPPNSLLNQIPSATSGTCTITCVTAAGTTTATITLYVADSVKPTISSSSMTRVNDNATVAAWAVYLQNYSKIQIAFQAAAQYSTIAAWRIEIGAATFEASNLSAASINISRTSDILTSAATYEVKITVTDARGRVATVTVGSYTVLAYANPTATNVQIYRCLQDGTADSDGTYLYAIATRFYSQVGNNACSMYFEYKEVSASTWTRYATAMQDNTGIIAGNGTINILKSYNARIYVEDSLGGAYVYVNISTQTVAFNLRPSQDSGAAFGGYAETDKYVELQNGWKLRVPSDEHITVWDGQTEKTLKQLIAAGGGGGGTSDYDALSNRPSINGTTLTGNKTAAQLGLEATNNKVTSLSGSSTDTQYPSAKCVWDMVGDVESALAALIGS